MLKTGKLRINNRLTEVNAKTIVNASELIKSQTVHHHHHHH